MRTVALVGSIICLVVSQAAAQTQPRTFTLQVTEADLITIGKALEVMPYRDVATLIARLQQQITDQTKALPAPVGAGEDKKQFGVPE